MNYLRILSRLLVGLVFVFSGFVKAIDPLGSTYKFIDYFNAFGLGYLELIAFPLAIVLSSIELVLGITLLLGYRMKISSWILLIFMSFFTILTFVLALTDPVHDCGCFGDALILTNWQTFWKNIVIMIFTLIIFFSRNIYARVRSALKEWMVIIGFIIITLTISVYCFHNLPILDFRPYSIGTYIPDEMIIPEDAPQSEFETILYYRNKKNGDKQEFTMQNFPADTSTWEFVDAITTEISIGYEPPIHDFNIISPDETEITTEILNDSNYTFMLISFDALKANAISLKKANTYYRLSRVFPDINFYAVSSTLRENLDSIRAEYGIEYNFCQADEITLKTIVRSNPGLVLIKNGTILNKWHFNNFPDSDEFGALSATLTGYPFCSGCDLRDISAPPSVSASEEYETILYYKSLESGEIMEFTLYDFPQDTLLWTFENSVSTKISKGFTDPLAGFVIRTTEGIDISENALYNKNYSLLLLVENPESLNDEEFQSMNKFGAMAGEYLGAPVDVYPVTGIDRGAILSFAEDNISAFDYFSGEPAIIKELAGDSVRAILINNGTVVKNWYGNKLPDPAVLVNLKSGELRQAETVLTPMVVSRISNIGEKSIVYIFVLSFLFIVLVLRLYFNMKESDA